PPLVALRRSMQSMRRHVVLKLHDPSNHVPVRFSRLRFFVPVKFNVCHGCSSFDEQFKHVRARYPDNNEGSTPSLSSVMAEHRSPASSREVQRRPTLACGLNGHPLSDDNSVCAAMAFLPNCLARTKKMKGGR